LSIKFKLTISTISVFLLMAIIIGMVFSSVMKSTLTSEAKYDAGQLCHETSYSLEKSIMSDVRVIKTLASSGVVPGNASDFLSVLQSSVRLSKYEYIALQWNDEWYMVKSDNAETIPAPSGISHEIFSGVFVGYLFDNEQQGLLVIEPLADDAGVVGKLVAKRPISWLTSIVAQENTKQDASIILAQGDGRIIYPEGIGSTIVSGTDDDSTITVSSGAQEQTLSGMSVTLNDIPFIVSSYVNTSAVDEQMGKYVQNYLLFAACCLVIISIVVYAISSLLTRSVIELARYTEKVELTGGRMPAKFTRRNDEAGILARSFALMMNKVSGSLVKMRHMAFHDNLTGLKNRYSMEQDIEKMINAKKPFAFSLMDIDDFKIINDMMGHSEGDRLLNCIARIFDSLESDTLKAYRWGGDEFAFILSGDGVNSYKSDIEKVLSEVATRFDSNSKWRISVSAGLCIFPDSATEYSRLLILADQALILAKRSGKARYRFYEDI
jgi:diguanylate cyclase (GGDEF)-like protein